MNKFVIACMMCLAVVSVTSAGYTDPLWNESEDRVYFDCGDWSGVDNHKDTSFGSHFYWFHKKNKNWKRMFTPSRWGYPSDARLFPVQSDGARSEDIAWACVHIHGFDKTLNVNGKVYTDDQFKINYKTGYLEFIGFSTQHWLTYLVENKIKITNADGIAEVKNIIVFYSKNKKEGKDEKKTITCSPRDTIQYELCEKVNSTISVELINHSNYMILNVPTSENITGIKITASSENITAIYEKHTHCLKLNTSKSFTTCDLAEYKYHNFTGIVPFGSNSYLLQYEPDYTINVTLYTPFTQINAVVVVNETDAEPINTDLKCVTVWDVLYILVPISLIIWLMGLL